MVVSADHRDSISDHNFSSRFWQRTLFFSFHNHLILHILPLATFSFFRKSNFTRKEKKDFKMFIYKRMKPRSCSLSKKQQGVPEKLPSMEITLNEMCCFRRDLIRRRLNNELICVVVLFYSTSHNTF